jgi:hypothetical protein
MTSPSPGRRFSSVEGHRAARAPRRGSLPLVSVVVASNHDWQVLQRCLAGVVDHCARVRAEVVVARAAVGSDIDTLARMYPTVGFVEAPATASMSQLRAIGMREATGDVVVFVEDIAEFDPGWLDTFVRQAQRESGGASDSGQRLEVDWAAYLARYGVAPAVPGGHQGGAAATRSPLTEQGATTGSVPKRQTWLSGLTRVFRRANPR